MNVKNVYVISKIHVWHGKSNVSVAVTYCLFDMTKIELLWFKCPRCGKSFLSYVVGKILWDCHDDGICIDSDDYGIIHNNHVLNTVPNKRECRKCRKCMDLMSFQ